MEKHVIARGGRVFLLVAVGLRLAAFGCGQPESFKADAARLTGVGGSGAGSGGVTGVAGDVGAAGASAPSGAAGAAVLTGAGGSGQAGSTIGAAGDAGGAGQGGGAAGATASGGAGTGTDGGAGKGSTGGGAGAPDGGAKGPDGGEGGAGAGGSGGGGTGGGAGGAAGGVTGAAGTTAINYCDRARWTAKASVSVGDGGGPAAGIDGDLTTRWATNRSQDGTDYYLVSFGGTVKLSGITLNNTQTYPNDYPGAYAVYGSTDGTAFDATAFVTGSGTVNSTVITFAPRAVRAVRVAQTGTARSTNWWQIGEFQVTCATP